jgi:hypothetical protein
VCVCVPEELAPLSRQIGTTLLLNVTIFSFFSTASVSFYKSKFSLVPFFGWAISRSLLRQSNMLTLPSGDVINWPLHRASFHSLIRLISQRLAKNKKTAINTIPPPPERHLTTKRALSRRADPCHLLIFTHNISHVAPMGGGHTA